MAVLDRGNVPGAEDAARGGGFTSFVNMVAALMSLALIAGLCVWGYKLMVRDVSGVPVVRAIEGPMRSAPENPGGQLADHQGLAVNRVQSEGEAEPAAERLVLAPNPVDVIETDQAGLTTRPLPRAEATPQSEADDAAMAAALEPEITAPALLVEEEGGENEVAALAEPAQPETPAVTTDTATEADIQALADQLAAGAAPLSTPPEEDSTSQVAAMTGPQVLPADVPGVARSPRPLARPADLQLARATPATAPAAPGAVDVDPASIPAGTRLVQLGAYDSAEVAQQEWDKLFARFTDYMDGKSRVIQKAESGGRTFYRLRAMGFADLADARRFCAVLLAEGPACIPVQVR